MHAQHGRASGHRVVYLDSGGGVVPDINLDPSLAAASVLQGIIITTMKEGCGSAAANRVVTPPHG